MFSFLKDFFIGFILGRTARNIKDKKASKLFYWLFVTAFVVAGVVVCLVFFPEMFKP